MKQSYVKMDEPNNRNDNTFQQMLIDNPESTEDKDKNTIDSIFDALSNSGNASFL